MARDRESVVSGQLSVVSSRPLNSPPCVSLPAQVLVSPQYPSAKSLVVNILRITLLDGIFYGDTFADSGKNRQNRAAKSLFRNILRITPLDGIFWREFLSKLLIPGRGSGRVFRAARKRTTARMNVFVLNSGSSSLKFQIIATDLDRIQAAQDEPPLSRRGGAHRRRSDCHLSGRAPHPSAEVYRSPARHCCGAGLRRPLHRFGQVRHH